jgi:hypothetical protein
MTELANTDLDQVAAADTVQFFVVPWDMTMNSVGEPVTITCRYFDKDWKQVDTMPLASKLQFFRIEQRKTTGPSTAPKPPVELNVSLFSGVAKTLTETCGLNNSFMATGPDQATAILVPVMKDTTRGLILVFRYPGTGSDVKALVATTDPEIKNTSNTSAGAGG